MIIDLISTEHSLHAEKALRGLVGGKGIGKSTRAPWEPCFFQANGHAAAETVIWEEVMHNVNHLRIEINVLLQAASQGAPAYHVGYRQVIRD